MAEAPGVLRLPAFLAPKPGGVANTALLPPASSAALHPFGGSLTLFTFDAGGELKEHSTRHEAMIVVLTCAEGAALEVTLSGNKHTLAQGDALRLPAGERHAVRATGGRVSMLLAKARAAGEEEAETAAA
jgi:quercetin dioxygenase-like cupin family protein